MTQQRPLIFVHIPKTAGVTLSSIILRQFPADAVYQINGRLDACIEELRDLPDERKQRLRFIYGHVPFGLHNCLPRIAHYITLLRDPVDRIISIYYFALRRPEWGLHRQILDNKLSLADFVASEFAAEFHNQQTRFLSGSDEPVRSVVKARENLLNHFAVAGLMERFDESLLLFQHCFGWKNVFYRLKNVNRHRPDRKEVSAETIGMIEKANAMDIELCEIARERIDAVAADTPMLKESIRRFEALNGIYSTIAGVLKPEFLGGVPAAIRRIWARAAGRHQDNFWWHCASVPGATGMGSGGEGSPSPGPMGPGKSIPRCSRSLAAAKWARILTRSHPTSAADRRVSRFVVPLPGFASSGSCHLAGRAQRPDSLSLPSSAIKT